MKAIIFVLMLSSAGLLIGMFIESAIKNASGFTPALSWSNCQYPQRWSNPEVSCDNTDPAVPECIKALYSQEAEKQCIEAFTKEQEPSPVQNPPAANPIVNKCEGN